MAKCLHCGKEIPYEQCAVNFLFYHTVNDMDEDEKEACVIPLSKDYKEMRFVYNFIAPCLCYDCNKELEEYLVEFVNGEKEE